MLREDCVLACFLLNVHTDQSQVRSYRVVHVDEDWARRVAALDLV